MKICVGDAFVMCWDGDVNAVHVDVERAAAISAARVTLMNRFIVER